MRRLVFIRSYAEQNEAKIPSYNLDHFIVKVIELTPGEYKRRFSSFEM